MTDEERLGAILRENEPLWRLLERARDAAFPFPYYFTAGCVAQSVWNSLTNRDLTRGITDIDFIYYDGADLSYEAEDAWIKRVNAALGDDWPLDVKNEARAHLWYERHFGSFLAPLASLEAAIQTWQATAPAVGVRLEGDGLRVYAPFGLADLFGLVVRPNKAPNVTAAGYARKAETWRERWPELTILPWEE